MGFLPINLFDLSTRSTEARRTAAIPSSLINSDPIAWIERHFHIPETRGPIVLADYQQRAIRLALETDAAGLYRYSTIVWGDIKKSAKSTIAAAVALWRAFQIDAGEGWGSIYVIANDLKQADSRVAYYLRRAIQLNPILRDACKVRVGSYRVTLPHETFIEAIPIDPSGEAGSNADMVVFSELWGAHSKAQGQMWTEMTLPPNKFGKSFRWVETYAGYTGTTPVLEQLYAQTVTSGRRLDDDLEIFDAPDTRIFALWNTRPRLPWQTEAYYVEQRGTLLPDEFARVHRNQWSDGSETPFLPAIALWDACKQDVPPLGKHEPCILAMDAGESNDTFATGLISRHPTQPDVLAVRYVRGYAPVPGEPLDFDAIEADIRSLVAAYAVQELAYDPFLLGQMIRRLKSGPTPILTACAPFPQGVQRLESDKLLLDLIMQRRIAHDGDADLRRHIRNADKKLDTTTRKIRIVKRSYALKIDLAVMLSMGCARAAELLSTHAPAVAPGAIGQTSKWRDG